MVVLSNLLSAEYVGSLTPEQVQSLSGLLEQTVQNSTEIQSELQPLLSNSPIADPTDATIAAVMESATIQDLLRPVVRQATQAFPTPFTTRESQA